MMSLPQTLSTLLENRVTLELEGIDRMYLNVIIPRLQSVGGVVGFFKKHRNALFVSSALMDPISKAFATAVDAYAMQQEIPIVRFRSGERKDDIAKEHLAHFTGKEGILFIGKAQEKTAVFRTEKRKHPETGKTYPWIVKSTAMVNQYYFYGVDEDFGPFFLKYGSYFPYNAKLCINGHEYLKRQLEKEGIAYKALDNGILSCADPVRMQQIADDLSPEKIADMLHKWQLLLPYPFADEDTNAGYQYQAFILQAEFSLTQVLDRPQTGRLIFEQIIRENLDIGRPEQVQLIFERRVTKRTPGRFRTRVVTKGVTPSLHVDYKFSRIKQYFKEQRALRTETTINNTRDFSIGKRLLNLPLLRKVGFAANRNLLQVEQVAHNCLVSEETLQRAQNPLTVNGQRTSGLRFADAKVQFLLNALLRFHLQAHGFTNRELRQPLAEFLGLEGDISQGVMTYQLRRLRLHGLIERIRGSHRYRLTNFGRRLALFYTRAYARLLRPGMEAVHKTDPPKGPTRSGFDALNKALNRCCQEARLAA
jgi:hypothetical protein